LFSADISSSSSTLIDQYSFLSPHAKSSNSLPATFQPVLIICLQLSSLSPVWRPVRIPPPYTGEAQKAVKGELHESETALVKARGVTTE
jgi:hypothetical protein